MSTAATKEQMNELHGLIAKTLTSTIKAEVDKGEEGNPLAAIDKAIKFMKDNGITYLPEPADESDPIEDLDMTLASVLPFPISK